MDGGDLADFFDLKRTDKSCWDEKDALCIAAQMIYAFGKIFLLINFNQFIDYIHEKKIIHRDVKPSNVLMSQDKKTVFKNHKNKQTFLR